MSAVRLRATIDGSSVEIRVDDETPISDDPITLSIIDNEAHHTFLSLAIDEAIEIRDALTRAIDDAKTWKASER